MKRYKTLLTALAVACSVLSCTDKQSKTIETETITYSNNTEELIYSLELSIPKVKNDLDKKICDQLVDILEKDLGLIACFEEDERLFADYTGDKNDLKAHLDYISENTSRELGAKSNEMIEEAREYSDDYTPPAWSCEATLDLIGQNDQYAVFCLFQRVYYGGAHGGVIGEGYITFSKDTGERITKVVDESFLQDIQPLLVKGLNQYMKMFANANYIEDELFDYLLVDDGTIPLPSIVPYPSEEGWVFTYREYEVGPYAMGMPEFTIPFDELQPYLTPEAAAILK